MKKIYLKNTILGISILSIFSIGIISFAFEKSSLNLPIQNDFIVSPGKTEVYINPGETVAKNISITNRIGKKVKFILTTEDMIGTNDINSPIQLLGNEVGPYSLKNLIKPEITEFVLEHGEKIDIPVNISIPNNAEPRGYYGALIVSNEPEVINKENSEEVEGGARLVSRIGSLFLVRINGEGKEGGNLEYFKILGPIKSIYQNKPKGFEIAFKNTGNVHLVPYGLITIKNFMGSTIGEIPVDAYFSMPDSLRYREVKWGEGTGLGRYTAELSLYKGYGNDTEKETAKVSFWIIPWKILITTFIGLTILISFVYYILTRFELKKK